MMLAFTAGIRLDAGLAEVLEGLRHTPHIQIINVYRQLHADEPAITAHVHSVYG